MTLRDIFGNELTEAEARHLMKRKSPQPKGYAAPPGSGPAGETCKSCRHIRRSAGRAVKTFLKCGLVRETAGPGTDIRAKAPACRRWEPRPATETQE